MSWCEGCGMRAGYCVCHMRKAGETTRPRREPYDARALDVQAGSGKYPGNDGVPVNPARATAWQDRWERTWHERWQLTADGYVPVGESAPVVLAVKPRARGRDRVVWFTIVARAA